MTCRGAAQNLGAAAASSCQALKTHPEHTRGSCGVSHDGGWGGNDDVFILCPFVPLNTIDKICFLENWNPRSAFFTPLNFLLAENSNSPVCDFHFQEDDCFVGLCGLPRGRGGRDGASPISHPSAGRLLSGSCREELGTWRTGGQAPGRLAVQRPFSGRTSPRHPVRVSGWCRCGRRGCEQSPWWPRHGR